MRLAILPKKGTSNLFAKLECAVCIIGHSRLISYHLPIEGIGVPVGVKREEPDQTEISEHDDPAEKRPPGEQEMENEHGGEYETGLPGMESGDIVLA